MDDLYISAFTTAHETGSHCELVCNLESNTKAYLIRLSHRRYTTDYIESTSTPVR